jgi:replicative superfamily II helicase
MVKFDVSSGNFFSTDVGRVASHYYIHHESVEKYNAVGSFASLLLCISTSHGAFIQRTTDVKDSYGR